jgi:hypothetical protein
MYIANKSFVNSGLYSGGGGLNFNPAEDAFHVREQAGARTLVLSLLGLCKAMDWGRVAMYSPHFTRKSLRRGAVQGESVLVGGLKGCYWCKTV